MEKRREGEVRFGIGRWDREGFVENWLWEGEERDSGVGR